MHNRNALSGGGDSLKPFRGAGVIASGCGAVAPVPLWAVKPPMPGHLPLESMKALTMPVCFLWSISIPFKGWII